MTVKSIGMQNTGVVVVANKASLLMAKTNKYTTVKLLTEVVEQARVVVAIRKLQLSDFLSEQLRSIVAKEYDKAIQEAARAKNRLKE